MGKEMRHVALQSSVDPSGADQTNQNVWVNQTGKTISVRKVRSSGRFVATVASSILEVEVSKQNAFLSDNDEQWALPADATPEGNSATGHMLFNVVEYFYEGAFELEAGDALRQHLNGTVTVSAGELRLHISYND